MVSAYIFCLIIGGLFVALSAFAGLDGVDFDQDFEADLEIINKKINKIKPQYINVIGGYGYHSLA